MIFHSCNAGFLAIGHILLSAYPYSILLLAGQMGCGLYGYGCRGNLCNKSGRDLISGSLQEEGGEDV